MVEVRKVFLDANVLFTASYNPNGLAFSLIHRAKALKLEIHTSKYAYEEAFYNLALKAPHSLETLKQLSILFKIHSISVDSNFNPLHLPSDDVPIFQGALECQTKYLLTGDKKAFGKWMNKPKETYGLKILTIRDFVDTEL